MEHWSTLLNSNKLLYLQKIITSSNYTSRIYGKFLQPRISCFQAQFCLKKTFCPTKVPLEDGPDNFHTSVATNNPSNFRKILEMMMRSRDAVLQAQIWIK